MYLINRINKINMIAEPYKSPVKLYVVPVDEVRITCKGD